MGGLCFAPFYLDIENLLASIMHLICRPVLRLPKKFERPVLKRTDFTCFAN
jgi:hypothetical protein